MYKLARGKRHIWKKKKRLCSDNTEKYVHIIASLYNNVYSHMRSDIIYLQQGVRRKNNIHKINERAELTTSEIWYSSNNKMGKKIQYYTILGRHIPKEDMSK